MLNRLLKYAVIFMACFLCFNAKAQTDTSYYDLGRIRIKKDFTQSVTIKAEELEKFPGTTLYQAISTWLSGTFTLNNQVIFVIDGDLINDVNAYSVFDIETVTLIQNASALLNGVITQKSLVLVQTRKNRPGKQGVMVAGQTNVIQIHNNNGIGDIGTNLYHLYHVSAYQNIGDTHFGVSADYQRDVNLYSRLFASQTSDVNQTTNRYKFYGYFDTKISSNSLLNVSVNYVPETLNSKVFSIFFNPTSTYTQNTDQKYDPKFLNTRLALSSKLSDNLYNHFSFNYNFLGYSETSDITQSVPSNSHQGIIFNNADHNFLVKNDLQYQYTNGNWHIDPEVNLSARYSKNNNNATNSYISGGTVGYLASSMETKFNNLLLTPSVNVYYKNVFDIQGGLVAKLKADGNTKTLSPYVTMSVDVLGLTSNPYNYGLKIFASYSNSGTYNDVNGLLADFNYGQTTSPQAYQNTTAEPNVYYQAGVAFSFLNNRFKLDYNYDNRKFPTPISLYTSTGVPITQYLLEKTQMHRISIGGNILDGKKLKWYSSLNTSRIIYDSGFTQYSNLYFILPNDKSWTGGWINRFDYQKISIAADVLYQINQSNIPLNISSGTKSFMLQNAYISYHINTKKLNAFEVYANARNIVQNSSAVIIDNRLFYGLGFKLAF